jgi:NADH-quinone oxidoreductase subunit H
MTAPSKPPRISPRAVVVITLAVAVGLPSILFGAVLALSPLSKPAMIAALVRRLGHDPATWPYTTLLTGLLVGLLAFVLVNFGAIISGMTVWWEMRVRSRKIGRSHV